MPTYVYVASLAHADFRVIYHNTQDIPDNIMHDNRNNSTHDIDNNKQLYLH